MANSQALQRQGWYLTAEGIKECEENGKNRVDDIIKVALDLDLKDIGERHLPEGVGKGKTEFVDGPFVLQIQKIRNVSAPKENEESQGAPKLFKLVISDGHFSCTALEMENIPSLGLNTAPGTKIKLLGKVPVSHSFLLLNPNNCKILGGRVDKLVENWELKRSLAKHSRATVRGEGGPPAFIPFGQKRRTNEAPPPPQGRKDNFKSLETTKEKKEENTEFEKQRQIIISEALNSKDDVKEKKFEKKPVPDSGVAKIVEMGFTAEQASMALRQNNGNVQQAIDYLLNKDSNQRWGRGPQRDSRDSRDSRDFRDRGPPPDREDRGERPERGRGRRNRDEEEEDDSAKPSAPATLFDFLTKKIPAKGEGKRDGGGKKGDSSAANAAETEEQKRAHQNLPPRLIKAQQRREEERQYRDRTRGPPPGHTEKDSYDDDHSHKQSYDKQEKYQSNRGQSSRGGKNYDQGSRNQDQGGRYQDSRNYDRGYDQGGKDYESRRHDQSGRGHNDRGGRGHDSGGRGHSDRGARGHDSGGRGHNDRSGRGYNNQGGRDHDSGGRYDQGNRNYDQGNRNYDQGDRYDQGRYNQNQRQDDYQSRGQRGGRGGHSNQGDRGYNSRDQRDTDRKQPDRGPAQNRIKFDGDDHRGDKRHDSRQYDSKGDGRDKGQDNQRGGRGYQNPGDSRGNKPRGEQDRQSGRKDPTPAQPPPPQPQTKGKGNDRSSRNSSQHVNGTNAGHQGGQRYSAPSQGPPPLASSQYVASSGHLAQQMQNMQIASSGGGQMHGGYPQGGDHHQQQQHYMSAQAGYPASSGMVQYSANSQTRYSNAPAVQSQPIVQTAQVRQWKPRDQCLARYWEDKQFYRAVINSVNPNNQSCVVYFAEYGNTEEVSMSEMKPIQQKQQSWDQNAMGGQRQVVVSQIPATATMANVSPSMPGIIVQQQPPNMPYVTPFATDQPYQGSVGSMEFRGGGNPYYPQQQQHQQPKNMHGRVYVPQNQRHM